MNLTSRLNRRSPRLVGLIAATGLTLSLVGGVTSAGVASPRPNGPIILRPPFVVGVYDWQQGQPTVTLRPTSEAVCVLTRVSGDFRGGGESVRLFQESGVWKLGGSSEQSEVAASATCFRISRFTAGSDGPWLSAEESLGWNTGTQCITRTRGVEPGDAATFLTGMTGDFAGAAERVFVTQSESGTAPSLIGLGACQDHDTYFVRAHSFTAGRWARPAMFVGPSGYGPLVHDNQAFYVNLDGAGSSTVSMARTDEAMCYLTGIGGKFRGGGEAVQIVRRNDSFGVERWFLEARSEMSYSGTTRAAALCYARNQG